MAEDHESTGLFRLFPRTNQPYNPADYRADIVAVHGLNGNSHKTWADKDGHLWLRDSLPAYVPGTRIMTFGYNSAVFFSSSRATIRDYVADLALRLEHSRSNPEEKERPLIFVCHSLGGIVFKALLVYLALRSFATDADDSLIRNISGVAFLGCPHRGSRMASLASMLSRILNTASLGNAVRSDLVRALQVASPILDDISSQASPLLAQRPIVSLYELRAIGFGRVVERFSAILELANERAIPVDADHREIARVSPRKPQRYLPVWTSVKELVDGSVSRIGSSVSINDENDKLLQALFCHDFKPAQMAPREPQRGTCQWIFQDTEYKAWLSFPRPSMLLMTGKPGSGKSVLTRHIAERLHSGSEAGITTSSHDTAYQGVSLFCSNIPAGQDNLAIVVRSLLLELVRINPVSGVLVLNRLEHRNKFGKIDIILDIKRLWGALIDVLSMHTMRHIFLVIDAVEELGPTAAESVVRGLWSAVEAIQQARWGSRLRVFVSTRRMVPSYTALIPSGLQVLQPSQWRMQKEIRIYLESGIDDLVEENDSFGQTLSGAGGLRENICERIAEAASGVFLAGVVAWEDFRKGLLWNEDVVETKLKNVISAGSGLSAFYDSIIARIDSGMIDDALTIFSVIAVAHHRLSDLQLGTILGIGRTTRPIKSSSDFRVFTNLCEVVEKHFPELLTVHPDNTIGFIHLSFKEHLASSSKFSHVLDSGRRLMGRVCTTYLKLEDMLPALGQLYRRQLEKEYPLLDYAQSWVLWHLKTLPSEDPLWLVFSETAGKGGFYDGLGGQSSPLQEILDPMNLHSINLQSILVLVRRFASHGYDLDELWAAQSGKPLHYCCNERLEPAAILLVDLGASPCLRHFTRRFDYNESLGFFSTPTIIAAALDGCWGLFDKLIAHSMANLIVEQTHGFSYRTILHELVLLASVKSVPQALDRIQPALAAAADANVQDREGLTPLHIAASFGNADVVRTLISSGRVNIHMTDRQGRTALAIATYWGQTQAALALIESSKALPMPARGQLSPLAAAAKSAEKILTVRLIQATSPGTLGLHLDLAGMGILHHAACNDWSDVIEMCLRHVSTDSSSSMAATQFSPDQIDHSGRTPLHHAAALGNIASCRALLNAGASVTLKDRGGRTPAQAAADAGFKDALMLFINSGRVDATQRDFEDRDLAHWAATLDCVDVMMAVERLPGARLDRADRHGKRPIDIAYICKCRNVGLFLASRQPHLNIYPWASLYSSPTVVGEEEPDRDAACEFGRFVISGTNTEEYEEIQRKYPFKNWGLVWCGSSMGNETDRRVQYEEERLKVLAELERGAAGQGE